MTLSNPLTFEPELVFQSEPTQYIDRVMTPRLLRLHFDIVAKDGFGSLRLAAAAVMFSRVPRPQISERSTAMGCDPTHARQQKATN